VLDESGHLTVVFDHEDLHGCRISEAGLNPTED
jgi:hypothetical protein